MSSFQEKPDRGVFPTLERHEMITKTFLFLCRSRSCLALGGILTFCSSGPERFAQRGKRVKLEFGENFRLYPKQCSTMRPSGTGWKNNKSQLCSCVRKTQLLLGALAEGFCRSNGWAGILHSLHRVLLEDHSWETLLSASSLRCDGVGVPRYFLPADDRSSFPKRKHSRREDGRSELSGSQARRLDATVAAKQLTLEWWFLVEGNGMCQCHIFFGTHHDRRSMTPNFKAKVTQQERILLPEGRSGNAFFNGRQAARAPFARWLARVLRGKVAFRITGLRP